MKIGVEIIPMQKLPDAIIANPLGSLEEDPDYTAAKAGDVDAGIKVASRFVTPELIDKLRHVPNPIVVGVVSLESTGHNSIPHATAGTITKAIDGTLDLGIVQINTPHRTTLKGLDRVFSRPEFEGLVEAGRNYILVDDTLTQGGTFAALSDHIHSHGSRVSCIIALSGKQYSAKLELSEQTLAKLRNHLGGMEDAFEQATGHRFDRLTESEGRYLANFKPVAEVRDRISQEARKRSGLGDHAPAVQDGLTDRPIPERLAVRPAGGLQAFSYLARQLDAGPAPRVVGPKP